MKAIMISIKPKWVAKILNGEKTIEIRKTMPKCDLPIDVYIYCTKDKENLLDVGYADFFSPRFIIRKDHKNCAMNGKVVAKFTLNKVEELYIRWGWGWETKSIDNIKVLESKTCLTRYDFAKYLKGKKGYAWHISNLVIFDKPKEISEFWHYNPKEQHYRGFPFCDFALTKSPQSWQFIEVE